MATINNKLVGVILADLTAAGYPAAILGGYPRDKFFGLTPKDVDICVAVGHLDPYDLDEDIARVNWQVSDRLFQACYKAGLHVERNVMGRYNDAGGGDRICGVIKYEHDGIDVILYRDCTTVKDIVDAFDFNLNQFWLADVAEDLTNEPVYVGSTDLRTLTPVREDASIERVLKVKRKHEVLLPEINRAYAEGRLV